ncbi:hypothetical protein Gotri_009934 [Gossypium trilobum]|uniref:RNase H type-1 domain-containing protein n=1 Tax=Gossypium trilobum TaxID=34281 RepID=A0A7J9EPS4_9ROSI|nr:hypothetical protein [Gossypium trilobum]
MGIWFNQNVLVWKHISKTTDQLGLREVMIGRKPSNGMLKCNVNGATFVDNEHVGWVAVLHNDVGGFIRCILGFMNSSSDPFMAEILTVREALFWLRSLHLDGVVMKIGSKRLWQVAYLRRVDTSDSRLLLKNCVAIVFRFQSFNLHWVRMDVNKIAHALLSLLYCWYCKRREIG